MFQLVLIRSGSTDFDAQGRIQGTLDIPLSLNGKEEVREAISGLKPLGMGILYLARCQAARESADILSEALGIKVKVLEDLRNLDHGLWQGMLIEEVKHKQPKVFRQWQEQPESVCPPEGETFSDAHQRVESVLAKLRKKHKEGVIGLVAPEPLASIVRCCMLQADLGQVWANKLNGGNWEVLGATSSSLSYRGCDILASDPLACEPQRVNGYGTNGPGVQNGTIPEGSPSKAGGPQTHKS